MCDFNALAVDCLCDLTIIKETNVLWKRSPCNLRALVCIAFLKQIYLRKRSLHSGVILARGSITHRSIVSDHEAGVVGWNPDGSTYKLSRDRRPASADPPGGFSRSGRETAIRSVATLQPWGVCKFTYSSIRKSKIMRVRKSFTIHRKVDINELIKMQAFHFYSILIPKCIASLYSWVRIQPKASIFVWYNILCCINGNATSCLFRITEFYIPVISYRTLSP